jgi:malonyl-CoA decarboxylase
VKNFLIDIAKAGRELIGLTGERGRVSEFNSLCSELIKLKGEASAVALADDLLARYAGLDAPSRTRFFVMLLDHMQPAEKEIERAISDYQDLPAPHTLMNLCQAAESPRRDLFRALNMAPDGTSALVKMREDLLKVLNEEPQLKPVDSDFSYLFRLWFNRGFLSLRRIDWHTPAHILEKLIAYEAVHEIRGWDDLRRRLAADRRCFAFFHPALPEEPLIFVEVALVRGLAGSIQQLIEMPVDAKGREPDTAIFYSISNCQRGLGGVSFGNFLIKQVTDMLAEELTSLKRYATLSPIPGFCRWLNDTMAHAPSTLPLKAAEFGRLDDLKRDGWYEDKTAIKKMESLLRRLCAHYIMTVKSGSQPHDSVARFHLRNGARLERINWLADKSAKGIRESATMMVNYVYDLKSVLRNHEAFVNEGTIAASSAVRNLIS